MAETVAAEISEEDYGDDDFHSDDDLHEPSADRNSPGPAVENPVLSQLEESKAAGTMGADDKPAVERGRETGAKSVSPQGSASLSPHSSRPPVISPGKYHDKRPPTIELPKQTEKGPAFDADQLLATPTRTPKLVGFDLHSPVSTELSPVTPSRSVSSARSIDRKETNIFPIQETGPIRSARETPVRASSSLSRGSSGSSELGSGGRHALKSKHLSRSFHSSKTQVSPHSSLDSLDETKHGAGAHLGSLLARTDSFPTGGWHSSNLHGSFNRSTSNVSAISRSSKVEMHMQPIDGDALSRLEGMLRSSDVHESGVLGLQIMRKLLSKSMLLARTADVELALEYADTDGSSTKISYEKFISKLSTLHQERTDQHNIQIAKKVFSTADNSRVLSAQLKTWSEDSAGMIGRFPVPSFQTLSCCSLCTVARVALAWGLLCVSDQEAWFFEGFPDVARMREILADPPYLLTAIVIDCVLKQTSYKPHDNKVDVTKFLSAMAPTVDLDIYGPVRVKLMERYQTMHNAFQAISKDKKFIPISELQTVLEKLNTREDHIKGIIKNADIDGSGTIEYDEFISMFRMDMKYAQIRNNRATLSRQHSGRRLSMSASRKSNVPLVAAEETLVDALEYLLDSQPDMTLLKVFKNLDVHGQSSINSTVLRSSLEEQGMKVGTARALRRRPLALGFSAVYERLRDGRGALTRGPGGRQISEEEATEVVAAVSGVREHGTISFQQFAERYRPLLRCRQPSVRPRAPAVRRLASGGQGRAWTQSGDEGLRGRGGGWRGERRGAQIEEGRRAVRAVRAEGRGCRWATCRPSSARCWSTRTAPSSRPSRSPAAQALPSLRSRFPPRCSVRRPPAHADTARFSAPPSSLCGFD